VILLDENLLRSQREYLEALRLPVRKVGLNWGRAGMHDDEIITELQGARRVTLFTRDADFYRWVFCHPAFLRHRAFRTHALRMGKVARLQPSGIVYWRLGSHAESFQSWN